MLYTRSTAVPCARSLVRTTLSRGGERQHSSTTLLVVCAKKRRKNNDKKKNKRVNSSSDKTMTTTTTTTTTTTPKTTTQQKNMDDPAAAATTIPTVVTPSPSYLHAHATRAGSFPTLAARNFKRELGSLIEDFPSLIFPRREPGRGGGAAEKEEQVVSEEEMPECFGFTLDNDAILRYDAVHPAPGPQPAPAAVQALYEILLFFVDRLYEGRAVERFWFLETVARMPYFAYTTCLHLYETMGWYRAAELRRVHFAEEWNELHHLLIMEAMGGDKRWRDRFLGQHAAVFYYWVLVVVFFISPSWSYKFSEMLETHAVSTYGEFIAENKDKLAQLPAPQIARSYYSEGDLYMFDSDSDLVRRAVGGDPRRSPCETLLDVFKNILADELEHVKTMALCQDYDSLEQLVSSGGDGGGGGSLQGRKSTSELLDPVARKKWTEWADQVNRDYGGDWLYDDDDENKKKGNA